MKKTLILFSILAPAFAFGQITILDTDLPIIGDTIPRQQDTLTISTEGPSGANQIWDFSNATAHVLNNTAILDPSATPYSSNFSGSNMAMSNDGASYVYLSSYTDSFITDGAAGDLLGTGEILKALFKPSLTLNKYPTSYGNNYQDTYGFDVSADGSFFSILLDSIRLKHSATVYDTVDGWGTTITPTGSYNSLRVKRVEYSIDSIWTLPIIGFPPAWAFLDAFTDTTTTFTWLAKEGKLAIAELNFDSLDNPNVLTWSLMPTTPIALFSYTDNGGGYATFTDLSSNAPTSWAWDFGDGNTSNQQHPNNIYTIQDSTYNVCLTATNSAGSDSYCDSVFIVDTIIALPVRESISNSFNISFNPNPASEKTTIQFSDNYLAAEIDLCLFNAMGQKVFQENFKIKPDGNFEIELNQLKAGVYFYYLKEIGSDKAGSGKLVIE